MHNECDHNLCSSEIRLKGCPAYGDVKVQQVVGGGEEPPHIYETTDIMGPGVGIGGDEGAYEITN